MPDISLKSLARAKAEVARLEQAVTKARAQELASLPAKYHFDSVADFIAAVSSAGRNSRPVKSSSKQTPAGVKPRKRAEITDKIRSKVLELVRAGKSGSAIAAAVGISLPSVQNIKKAAGMVKSRAPKVPKMAKPATADKTKKTAPTAK